MIPMELPFDSHETKPLLPSFWKFLNQYKFHHLIGLNILTFFQTKVIKALTSLKSRGYVKEQFAWRHYYWWLIQFHFPPLWWSYLTPLVQVNYATYPTIHLNIQKSWLLIVHVQEAMIETKVHRRYLTNEGIQYLRDYLHLPSEIVPSTLKRALPRGDARPARTAAPRPGADKPEGDRAAYR